MEEILEAIYQGIIDGDMGTVQVKTEEGIASEAGPERILNEALVPAMAEVGHRFEIGEFFVPEMLIAARAMKAGMTVIKPKLIEQDVKPVGKVLIGTVKGDLHDIGKNLGAMMLEGAGFEVIDLGIDVPPEKFVEAVTQQGVQIVCMSALLTTTMPSMQTTLEALQESGQKDKARTMIGGAPITQAFADRIGADGFAADAASAADKAKELIADLKAAA